MTKAATKKHSFPIKNVRSRNRNSAAASSQGAFPLPDASEARDLAHQIAGQLLDKKGVEVLILDVRGKTSYTDYLVIASGESERQVSAMADSVQENLGGKGIWPLGSEGYESGSWILLDFGGVVAHLFFAETRAFYDLEGLWSDAPREKVA
jgi:ribosome-associated protein